MSFVVGVFFVAMAVTVMATVSLSLSGVPALSVETTVRVSLPLKLALPW